jgi:hypothetical protein
MKIELVSGGEAEFDLPDPDQFRSTYFFSMERSGSSLFWTLVRKLLHPSHRSRCQILEDLFRQGITRREVSTTAMRDLLKRQGYAFGMFRELDPALEGLDISGNRKFLLVRDPRDILVSLFFSMAGTHRIPEQGTARSEILELQKLTRRSIGEFVRSSLIEGVAQRYLAYAQFCRTQQNVTIFRYEDVIFSKREWVLQIVDLMELSIGKALAIAIADQNDVLPLQERASENIRQVQTGNFLKHLDGETIAFIEDKFAESMAFFGYVPYSSVPDKFIAHRAEFFPAVFNRIRGHEDQLYRRAIEIKKLSNAEGR